MLRGLGALLAVMLIASPVQARQAACDRPCLDAIGAQYMAAYLAHEPARAPLAKSVRFTENNVAMPLPDGTWDTVGREVGPAFTASDPVKGEIGIFTSIMQNDVPGFLSIRLKVRNRKIVEVEQIVATQRNLSLAKLGDVEGFVHDPDLAKPVMPDERMERGQLEAMADGYFETLQKNDGKLRGVRFAPATRRLSNGILFDDVGKALESGFFRFNDRVRDRRIYVVDEARGVVMASGILDHKGRLNRFKLADGTEAQSPYREPHSLLGVELFKIKGGEITAMETIYAQLPYNMSYAW